MARKFKVKMKAPQAELQKEKMKGPNFDSQVKNVKSMDSVMGVSLLEIAKGCPSGGSKANYFSSIIHVRSSTARTTEGEFFELVGNNQ